MREMSFHFEVINKISWFLDIWLIHICSSRGECKIHTSVTKYFEPGWKLTRGSFFNVEYWTSGAFSPLKIETKSRWKYTRGHFSTALQIHFFFLNFYDSDTLNIDPVENWPQTTEVLKSFYSMNNSPCYKQIFFWGWVGGRVANNGGSFCIEWTVSRQKSILIASYF
jgi:hypothetical protein